MPNLFRNYGSKNIFLAILLRLSSTLKQIWRIVNRIGFPITEYIAMCWRLKCFINSYVIKSSGQIPDRRDCIAFFALLILPPLIENVSQNDVMYKTAVYYDVTVSQTSRVFSSHSSRRKSNYKSNEFGEDKDWLVIGKIHASTTHYFLLPWAELVAEAGKFKLKVMLTK